MQLPLKDRNTVMALVTSLVIVAGGWYVYSSYVRAPIRRDIQEQQKNIEDFKRKLEVAKATAQRLTSMQQEMASLQVDVAQLEKQLPKDRELPALIRVLTHRAESFGVVLGTLAPGQLVAKGLYDEIPYNVSVTASFHSLAHFLTALGKGDRLFAARNLVLTPNAARTDFSKTVNATFTLIAFKYHG